MNPTEPVETLLCMQEGRVPHLITANNLLHGTNGLKQVVTFSLKDSFMFALFHNKVKATVLQQKACRFLYETRLSSL